MNNIFNEFVDKRYINGYETRFLLNRRIRRIKQVRETTLYPKERNTMVKEDALPTMFNYHRIVYDNLRYKRFIVTAKSVRFLSPPQELFIANYTSVEDECSMRVTRLWKLNWFAVFVSPAGCIVVYEDFPALPAESGPWKTVRYDKYKLKIDQNGRDQLTSTTGNNKILEHVIKPINHKSIRIPDNSMAILNYSKFPENIRVTGSLSKEGNLCIGDLPLNLSLSTAEDFLMPNKNDNLDFTSNGERPKILNASRPTEIDNYMGYLRRM